VVLKGRLEVDFIFRHFRAAESTYFGVKKEPECRLEFILSASKGRDDELSLRLKKGISILAQIQRKLRPNYATVKRCTVSKSIHSLPRRGLTL